MEDHKEPSQGPPNPEGQKPTENLGDFNVSQEMGDFNFLIATLIEYYISKAGMQGEMEDESERWKKGTKHDTSIEVVPQAIDQAVSKAFLHQLKRFQS